MKTVKTRDQNSRSIAVEIPDDHALVVATVGVFGWSATTRRAGWRYSWHNGQLISRTHAPKGVQESGIFQSSNTRPISQNWWNAAFGHLAVAFKWA